jgi:hypothetical protein
MNFFMAKAFTWVDRVGQQILFEENGVLTRKNSRNPFERYANFDTKTAATGESRMPPF